MKRKKQNYNRLHSPTSNERFLSQVDDWKERITALAEDMTVEHQQLSDAPIKDFSTAVMYQEFLVTAIGFLHRADEMLEEYKQTRMGNYSDNMQAEISIKTRPTVA